jgi:carbonic anhydrase
MKSAKLKCSLLAVMVTCACTAWAGGHWGYTGEHGADHWAEMDPAFETCGKGQHQSPINIQKTEKAQLPALNFQYAVAAPTIWNNGHTVQVNLPAGSKLTVGDQSYDLLQFHFHDPSEESLNGKRFPMVAHFVHKNAAGQLGVVGVLIKAGKPNAALAGVFEHLPREGEKITVDDLALNLAQLIPANHAYYSFEGSLTTPPCSEGVNWMVLKTPIELSPAQIQAFSKLVKFNARPIQKLNDRVVKESL